MNNKPKGIGNEQHLKIMVYKAITRSVNLTRKKCIHWSMLRQSDLDVTVDKVLTKFSKEQHLLKFEGRAQQECNQYINRTFLREIKKLLKGRYPDLPIDVTFEETYTPQLPTDNPSPCEPSPDFIDVIISDNYILEEALDSLSKEEERVIRLHYFDGLKWIEIAELLEINPHTNIYQIHKRAKEKLRRILIDLLR